MPAQKVNRKWGGRGSLLTCIHRAAYMDPAKGSASVVWTGEREQGKCGDAEKVSSVTQLARQ